MKTAISLPDQVFYEAEEIARYMGIPRSKLYLDALLEYLEKTNPKKITKKLNEVYNEVYTDDYHKEFELIENAGIESIREITKNDTW
jgi:metal-responsive CopG/Arc/MetJ family transcriptional regulator